MTASHSTGSAPDDAPLSSNVNPCALLSERDRQADYSRFVQRVRRRYSAELPCLPPGEPVLASMQACLADLRGRGLPMQAALRVLRQLVMERLVVLDCDGGGEGEGALAPLQVITRAMTELAELALMRDAGAKAVATGRRWIADSGTIVSAELFTAWPVAWSRIACATWAFIVSSSAAVLPSVIGDRSRTDNGIMRARW